jgi:hypothetical protein
MRPNEAWSLIRPRIIERCLWKEPGGGRRGTAAVRACERAGAGQGGMANGDAQILNINIKTQT